jgi:hypothetical protein
MDASDKPFWNLRTALCWIALGQTRDASLLRLQLEQSLNPEKFGGVDLGALFSKAECQLIGALGRGTIIAAGCECKPIDPAGINTILRSRDRISQEFWQDAEIDFDDRCATPKDRSIYRLWQFQDILIDAEEVKVTWPRSEPDELAVAKPIDVSVNSEASSSPAEAKAQPNADMQEWLNSNGYGPGGVRHPKKTLQPHFMAAFPGTPMRIWNAVFGEFAGTAGKRHRPRK